MLPTGGGGGGCRGCAGGWRCGRAMLFVLMIGLRRWLRGRVRNSRSSVFAGVRRMVMTGRREARAPSWGRYREVGWLWARLACVFFLVMASVGLGWAVGSAAVGDWRTALGLAWVPCWLVAAGGVLFGGMWVWRPELLGGRRWPQVWRRVWRRVR